MGSLDARIFLFRYYILNREPIFLPKIKDAAIRVDAKKSMAQTPNAAAVHGPEPKNMESS